MAARVIVIGPPASGKGTYSERLAADLALAHIATGDLLRAHVAAQDTLGVEAEGYMLHGQLVPDDLVVRVLGERLGQVGSGVVLDGFPRSLPQVQALEDEVGFVPTDVVVLDVPEDVLIERIGGRRVCPDGHVFHVTANPPREPGTCDVDGQPLARRADDTPATIRERLEVYRRDTEPLVAAYADRTRVTRIDGVGLPDDVYALVRDAVTSPST